MREFTIGKNDAGQRLDRFVSKNLPLLPPALLQKYIRLKRIKVNGKGSKRDARLCAGDVLQLYINDEFFDKPNEENLFLMVFKPQLNIVYEDENLLLVDKRPTPTRRRRSTPSSTTSRRTCTRKRNGTPGGRMPLPRPCATASTGTPAASSSPPRTRRPCASSTRRSKPMSWKNPTSASPWAAPVLRRAGSRAFC